MNCVEKETNPHFAYVPLTCQGYIKAKNYPSSTSVEVMAEGAESAMFKQLFQSWREKGQTHGLGSTHSVGRIGTTKCTTVEHFIERRSIQTEGSQTVWVLLAAKVDSNAKFDVMQLHARPELAAQYRMVDDASGDIKVTNRSVTSEF